MVRAASTVLSQPQDNHLFAALPEESVAPSVVLSGESITQGQTITYSIHTRVGEKTSTVFRIELADPDGKRMEYYAANIEAAQSAAKGKIQLALDECPGKWTFSATDVMTGQRKQMPFAVTASPFPIKKI